MDKSLIGNGASGMVDGFVESFVEIGERINCPRLLHELFQADGRGLRRSHVEPSAAPRDGRVRA